MPLVRDEIKHVNQIAHSAGKTLTKSSHINIKTQKSLVLISFQLSHYDPRGNQMVNPALDMNTAGQCALLLHDLHRKYGIVWYSGIVLYSGIVSNDAQEMCRRHVQVNEL